MTTAPMMLAQQRWTILHDTPAKLHGQDPAQPPAAALLFALTPCRPPALVGSDHHAQLAWSQWPLVTTQDAQVCSACRPAADVHGARAHREQPRISGVRVLRRQRGEAHRGAVPQQPLARPRTQATRQRAEALSRGSITARPGASAPALSAPGIRARRCITAGPGAARACPARDPREHAPGSRARPRRSPGSWRPRCS